MQPACLNINREMGSRSLFHEKSHAADHIVRSDPCQPLAGPRHAGGARGPYLYSRSQTWGYGRLCPRLWVVGPWRSTATTLLPVHRPQLYTLQVTSVTGENVTAAQTFVYANKTSVSDTILGSVATDSGNITFWFIAANLTAGDPIYTTPNALVINQTFTQTFAGAPRTVDALNITQIPTPGVVLFVNVWWDQATGILLLIDYRVTTPTGSASLFASLVETNIWSPVPQPGFGIDADPNFLIIQEGGSNSSTIGLVSELGFSGNITIRPVAFLCTPTSFCPIVTFTPSTVFLALGGEAFETMNITIPRGTVNGTHTIPVVAFSGSLENATSVTVNVVGPGPSDIPPIA